jgi:hypothetical protein
MEIDFCRCFVHMANMWHVLNMLYKSASAVLGIATAVEIFVWSTNFMLLIMMNF